MVDETLESRDPAPDPEQECLNDQTLLTLWKAIQRLPPTTRKVMDLYYRKERRLKETAAMLGINESTAKARILRARRLLRRSLEHQNPDAVNHKRDNLACESEPGSALGSLSHSAAVNK